MNQVILGDCRETLRDLKAQGVRVQCCVTSPPYYMLRDYNHGKQIGLEKTPAEYVAALVDVFDGVRDLLADDGVLWLNLGDSYSTGVANISNLLQRRLENGVFFFGGADPRGGSTESINVLIYDKRSPDLIFEPLFCAKRISVKNGQNDFCEIGGALDAPVQCFGSGAFRGALPKSSNAEFFMDMPEYLGIIVAAGDLNADAALRAAISISVKNSKTPLAIEISAEPVAEGVSSTIPTFDTISFHSVAECDPQVDSINETVPLLEAADLATRRGDYFSIRASGDKQVSFDLHGGADICFAGTGYLFLIESGLTSYCSLLDKAKREFNASRAKQELGVPEMLKRALMEAGWICRQTIIWNKPNPMPESVTDRCTKAHEYLFLLSKRERYFWDADAMKEQATGALPGNVSHKHTAEYESNGDERHRTKGGLVAYAQRQRSARDSFKRDNSKRAKAIPGQTVGTHRDSRDESEYDTGMRNRRSVWTVPTQPYAGAHFAVFPAALIEPCILAGSRPGDLVLDPFMGSGTTAQVAQALGRQWIGCELNPEYTQMQQARTAQGSFVLEPQKSS